LDTTLNTKKEKSKLTPEQLFQIYTECNLPNAPVKQILEKYNLKPWDLVVIRKKVHSAALEVLAQKGKPGRKQRVVPGEGQSGTAEHQRCIGRCRAQALLAKKKSGLNLEGNLKGHFNKEVKQKVVLAIKEAILGGLSQMWAHEI